MSMSKQILDKIARDLTIQGQSVTRGANNSVIVANGANPVTVGYTDAVFTPSMMGGVDGTASPFLGIGVGNPGQITLQRASSTTLAAVLSDAVSIATFAECAGFANDINLVSSADGVTVLLHVRGHSDMIGVGQ